MEQENLSSRYRRPVEMGEIRPLVARGRTPSGGNREGQSTDGVHGRPQTPALPPPGPGRAARQRGPHRRPDGQAGPSTSAWVPCPQPASRPRNEPVPVDRWTGAACAPAPDGQHRESRPARSATAPPPARSAGENRPNRPHPHVRSPPTSLQRRRSSSPTTQEADETHQPALAHIVLSRGPSRGTTSTTAIVDLSGSPRPHNPNKLPGSDTATGAEKNGRRVAPCPSRRAALPPHAVTASARARSFRLCRPTAG